MTNKNREIASRGCFRSILHSSVRILPFVRRRKDVSNQRESARNQENEDAD